MCVPGPQAWSLHRCWGSRTASPASGRVWLPCAVATSGGSACGAPCWPPALVAWRSSRTSRPPSEPAADTLKSTTRERRRVTFPKHNENHAVQPYIYHCVSTIHFGQVTLLWTASKPAVREHLLGYLLASVLVAVPHLKAQGFSQPPQPPRTVTPGHRICKY